MARIIAAETDRASAARFAEATANFFARENPQFNRGRYLTACGF